MNGLTMGPFGTGMGPYSGPIAPYVSNPYVVYDDDFGGVGVPALGGVPAVTSVPNFAPTVPRRKVY